MKASIIICYTNKALISKTIEYLDSQDVRKDFEIIAIDNSENKFSSAAKALNYGASVAIGEILIFMHQDVFCEHKTDIKQLLGYFDDINGLALVGVAGVDEESQKVCSNITETQDHIVRYEIVIDKLTEVETVDECLLAIKKNDFDKIKFDEEVCDDWHFYGVDLSYQVRLNRGKVYCAPVQVCHMSQGKLSIKFFLNLKKIGKKYKKTLPRINSTCIHIKNSQFVFNYILLRKYCSNLLKKKQKCKILKK